METILKLWYGKLDEESLFDEKMRDKIKDSMIEEETLKKADKFYESLTQEQRELLISYWVVESSEWSAEVDCAFIVGFKTGARLMMDVLKEN